VKYREDTGKKKEEFVGGPFDKLRVSGIRGGMKTTEMWPPVPEILRYAQNDNVWRG